MASNNPSDTSQGDRRPASIAELATKAQQNLWDPEKGLKHWLRTAEKSRRAGQDYLDAQDYESAFIEFARAATLVLERLPTHREYNTLLSADQRHNLGTNGQEILDSLSKLKPILVQRYEDWRANGGVVRTPSASDTREDAVRRKREEQQRAQEEERARQALEAARREQEWRREEQRKEEAETRERHVREEAEWARLARRDEPPSAAEIRRAADARAMAELERNAQAERLRREEDGRRPQSDDERREDERLRRRLEDKRRQEQDGILRRQQEADAAARAARRDIAYGLTPESSITPSPERSSQQDTVGRRYGGEVASATRGGPVSMPIAAPQSRPPSANNQGYSSESYGNAGPPPMPLESPTRYDYDSSTDVEGRPEAEVPWHRRQGHAETPTKGKRLQNGIQYPPPITTTSPAPPELGVVRYPTLMTSHQLKQGYVPSLRSMFSHLSLDQPGPDSALLFDSKSANGKLYADILPHASSAPPPSAYYGGMPTPDPHAHRYTSQSQSYSQVGQRGPSPSGARPPPPPPPIPPKEPITPPRARSGSDANRIVPGNSKEGFVRELRSVRLPRDCLPKFVSIARVNTAHNRETCGLLLGKDKGGKYVVTTLLIPKQHSTSDTCTMDEEELVLQFTEERHLITLGWIHTHPTQSCFMSSVDLHTHSGFQRMLPESFAVVCAPSSTPSFGIFRLTDPDGLKAILSCTAKEAFHPHAEIPIYTDCDNSHVQMKDMSIEIVDLRG